MTIEQIKEFLEQELTKCKDFYPDDDSRQAGYQDAIETVLDFVQGAYTP